MSGRILNINVKAKMINERGLPKIPIEVAEVTKMGLKGDYNVYRSEKKDNSLDQALLLMPIEMIQNLNNEGWPIKPGDLGENITTQGISYDAFEPGKQYKIGNVTLEITKACDPCHNLTVLPYVGKNYSGKFIRTMLNRRGWYGKVIHEGIIKKGDEIQEL